MYNLSKSGKWWLPGKQEKQFYGELNFNQVEGGALLLSDSLDKLYDFPTKNQNFILLGDLVEEGKDESNTHTKASVLIRFMTGYQGIGIGRSSIKIVLRLKYIFLGVHIENIDIELEKIAVSYSNLYDWISAIHDLEVDRSQDERTYNSPVITVNDECRIQITSSPEFHKEDSKLITEDNIQFIVESLGDKSFSHYLKLEGKIHDFLNFAITKKAVVTQSFEGFINQGYGLTSLTILFRSYVTERMHKINVVEPTLFRYSEVSSNFQVILNKWFQLYTLHKITIDLYFGVIYNINSFSFNNFLMLFTALEVYHRIAMDEHSKRKKEKELFADTMIRKLEGLVFSKDEKQKLKEYINFGKRLSFKEQIEEIYDQFSDMLPSLSSRIGDRNEFIRKVVDFRNDLIHGNVHPADLDKDNELFWQYRNLQLMLQLCILSQIGFDNEKIKKIYLLDKNSKDPIS